jgi:predicted O-methyltransferase YrrM
MPDALTTSPESNPTLLYRYRDAIYAADMLIVGLHLDLFTRLASRPSTMGEICDALDITPRPTDVMLTLFSAMGLLAPSGEVYQLTSTGRQHLVTGSPWYLGPYYPRLEDRPIARDLLTVLRTGKPANWGTHQANQDWHKAMEHEDFAASFTAAMDCRGIYLSQAVAQTVDLRPHRHLLDIAGGSGIYACVLAAHYPGLRATVLEKPPVDRIAAAAIAKRGAGDRVSVIAQDMRADPLPGFADVHLFSNVLHDWDAPIVTELIEKSFAALPPGGLVVVHDAFLNPAKTGPLHVAEYSVLLMHASEGRCYSTAEMASSLERAGFVEPHYTEGAAARGIMTARKPH